MGKKNTKEALGDETNIVVHKIVSKGVDSIIAGWPCQDLSVAARDGAAGLSGERSGLWRCLFRTIRLVRPKRALLENVAMLLDRGMGTILGDLAGIGNDAEWHCIQAKAVGLPHARKRLYTVTYPASERFQRHFPKQIQGEPELLWWQDYRNIEELPRRSDLYESTICGSDDGAAKRLYGVGNSNPPHVIKQIINSWKGRE